MTRASVRTVKTNPVFIGSTLESEGVYAMVVFFFFFFLLL